MNLEYRIVQRNSGLIFLQGSEPRQATPSYGLYGNYITHLGQYTDSGDHVRLDTIHTLPEIDIPQPDRNRIPPDIIRVPPTLDKDRVPLRIPWSPDRIPKKEKKDPFGIVH